MPYENYPFEQRKKFFRPPSVDDLEFNDFIAEQAEKMDELEKLVAAQNDPEVLEKFDDEFSYLDIKKNSPESAMNIKQVWGRIFDSKDTAADIIKKLEAVYTLPEWQDRLKIYCFITAPEMYQNKHLREQEGKKNLMGWHVFIWDKIKNTVAGRINNYVMKDKGKNILFRDHLFLDESYQKLGESDNGELKKKGSIGSSLIAREEDFIKNESKIRTLKLEAGKIGSYLWARCGYGFVYDLDRENVVQKVYNRCHFKGYVLVEPPEVLIEAGINWRDFYRQHPDGLGKKNFIDWLRAEGVKQNISFTPDDLEAAAEWNDDERAELKDLQSRVDAWDLAELQVYDSRGNLVHGGKEMIDTNWDGYKELSAPGEPLTRGERIGKKYLEKKRKNN